MITGDSSGGGGGGRGGMTEKLGEKGGESRTPWTCRGKTRLYQCIDKRGQKKLEIYLLNSFCHTFLIKKTEISFLTANVPIQFKLILLVNFTKAIWPYSSTKDKSPIHRTSKKLNSHIQKGVRERSWHGPELIFILKGGRPRQPKRKKE